MFPQVAATFHGIGAPFVVQTRLQQYRRCPSLTFECFADKKSIPWNLPTNFHPDPIATILQRCLPVLCALLSQQSHLFPICVALTYNDSRINFTGFVKFEGIASVNDFWLLRPLQELHSALLGLLRSFCLHECVIVSIALPNLVPPRRIEIHFLH